MTKTHNRWRQSKEIEAQDHRRAFLSMDAGGQFPTLSANSLDRRTPLCRPLRDVPSCDSHLLATSLKVVRTRRQVGK
jgi:hypothetical protein